MSEQKQKKQGITQTARQRKAARRFAKAILDGSDITKAEILKDSGYSKSIQETPAKVMNKEGFKLALEKYLPTDMLMDNHNDLIKQRVHIPSAVKALELAYTIKGVKSEQGGLGYAQFLQVINVSSDGLSERVMHEGKASE